MQRYDDITRFKVMVLFLKHSGNRLATQRESKEKFPPNGIAYNTIKKWEEKFGWNSQLEEYKDLLKDAALDLFMLVTCPQSALGGNREAKVLHSGVDLF